MQTNTKSVEDKLKKLKTYFTFECGSSVSESSVLLVSLGSRV